MAIHILSDNCDFGVLYTCMLQLKCTVWAGFIVRANCKVQIFTTLLAVITLCQF